MRTSTALSVFEPSYAFRPVAARGSRRLAAVAGNVIKAKPFSGATERPGNAGNVISPPPPSSSESFKKNVQFALTW